MRRLSGFPNKLCDCVRLSENYHGKILGRLPKSDISEDETMGEMFNNVLSPHGTAGARGLA